ncbi:MAG: modification methylase, partial [Firmicutes bacterium HGW-Firmicutes-18]
TSYKKSPIVGGQLPLITIEGLKPEGKEPYAIEINEVPDQNVDGATDLADVEYLLKHNANTASSLKADNTYNAGDFRSSECVALLKQADIVITNPPFSLFREYVAQLVTYNKQFIIIGNKNAITYKEIFKLIKENRAWVGATPMGVDMLFDVPEEYAKIMIENGKEGSNYKIVNGIVKGRSSSIWFTNMDNPKRHEEITLYRKYTSGEYPTYDNYDAIEVGRVAEIPVDYDGAMGVPITFLDKYNPEQFEIIGMSASAGYDVEVVGLEKNSKFKDARPLLSGKNTYARIFIKRKK